MQGNAQSVTECRAKRILSVKVFEMRLPWFSKSGTCEKGNNRLKKKRDKDSFGEEGRRAYCPSKAASSRCVPKKIKNGEGQKLALAKEVVNKDRFIYGEELEHILRESFLGHSIHKKMGAAETVEKQTKGEGGAEVSTKGAKGTLTIYRKESGPTDHGKTGFAVRLKGGGGKGNRGNCEKKSRKWNSEHKAKIGVWAWRTMGRGSGEKTLTWKNPGHHLILEKQRLPSLIVPSEETKGGGFSRRRERRGIEARMQKQPYSLT